MNIEPIKNLDIADVIGKYISLKKTGPRYAACCPFHNEKTPSFSVSPAKGIFKCFGCGEAGDAIAFVMKHRHLDFMEAVKEIADNHTLILDFDDYRAPDPETKNLKQKIFDINRKAAQWYADNLAENTKHVEALQYALNRWHIDIIKEFGIGYAPDGWSGLKDYMTAQGYSETDLITAGLCRESKGRVFDVFRNRIMFAIEDARGNITGFSGRYIGSEAEAPKYMNTSETLVYIKNEMLYGIFRALNSMIKTRHCFLVEGNPDVIRLQSNDAHETIAPCGTSLTPNQVTLIKKHCRSVTIIGDTDEAGIRAVDRSAEMLIKEGLFVNVILLPESNVKSDPDSFFATNDFKAFKENHTVDYIINFATRQKAKAKNPDIKQEIISHVANLISYYPLSSQELYIEQCSQLIKPKKAWKDELKTIESLTTPILSTDKEQVPSHVNANDFERYGFYEDRNQYFFRTNRGIVRGCNFSMKPLFHVQSVINAKRLYSITNEANISYVIELLQRDMISLAAFKLRVESLGNFLWEASETELNKLKRFLYEKTESCIEITQLGWQKEGFFAWANGIFNGHFHQVDKFGIARHNSLNYYIPALSQIYIGEPMLYMSERKFLHQPGSQTAKRIFQQIITVYGDNAKICICFYIATCFRDIIVTRFKFFPILNLFGPKGTGKSELALFMLHFFGKPVKGPNINNTSKAALADHAAQVNNAFAHIEEYKNSVEFEKVEFLKGLYDCTGRTRMNMDKDKKKETTAVDCGVILTGQEMPTQDIALFSRLIFLLLTKTTFNDTEKQNFRELKEMLESGVTHITHEILSCRQLFLDFFSDNFDAAGTDLMGQLAPDTQIEDRIFMNWVILVAAFRVIKDTIDTGLDYANLVNIAAKLMERQNSEVKRTSDVANFWDIFNFLVKDEELYEDIDFKVNLEKGLKTDKGAFDFTPPRVVIYLNHSRIFQKYRRHGAATRDNVLSIKTLEYYLKNSAEYVGKKDSVRFKLTRVNHMTESEQASFGESTAKYQITSSLVFMYDMLMTNYNIQVVKEAIEEAEAVF